MKNVINKKEFYMFSISALGQGMVYAIMSSYISDFYINVLQLPLLFVLLLMLGSRVWDAINDPIMGIIADSTTTKWGKYKPYILIVAIPIAILTFLLFFDPRLSTKNAMIYAGFIYVLWGMFYTVSDVPFWSLPNVMTPNPAERGKLISVAKAFNGVGSAFPMALFMGLGFLAPIVFPSDIGLDLERKKYLIMAIFASVVGISIYVSCFPFVKERLVSPKPQKGSGALKRIFSCKPLMLVVVAGVLSSGRYMAQVASIHVARYAFYIGPTLEGLSETARTAAISGSVSAVSTIFTICSAVGMMGAMVFMPALYKRFEYKRILIVTCIAGFVSSMLTALMGGLGIMNNWSWTVYACIPLIIISAIPLGALNTTCSAMIGDSLDYLEWQTGFRDNALGAACQSFVNKLGNALATTLVVLMYIMINLEPSQMLNSEVIMAATDLSITKRLAMFSLVSVVPGLSLLLCAIPLFGYNLTGDFKAKIVKELAERRENN